MSQKQPDSPLQAEFRYYLDHQPDLVEKYNGRVVVIRGHEILGVYSDMPTAVRETAKEHELGTFLVQKVEPGSDAYTRSFHSRVSLSPHQ